MYAYSISDTDPITVDCGSPTTRIRYLLSSKQQPQALIQKPPLSFSVYRIKSYCTSYDHLPRNAPCCSNVKAARHHPHPQQSPSDPLAIWLPHGREDALRHGRSSTPRNSSPPYPWRRVTEVRVGPVCCGLRPKGTGRSRVLGIYHFLECPQNVFLMVEVDSPCSRIPRVRVGSLVCGILHAWDP